MKICLLSMQRIAETYGGIESFTWTLFDWLNKKGADALIVSRRLSISNPIIVTNKSSKLEKPLKVTAWKFPLAIYSLGLIFYSFYSVLAMVKLFSKRGIDLIHAQDPSFSGMAGLIISKLFNVPLIVHLHGPPIYLMDKSFRSPIWQAIDNVLTKISVNYADAIFVTDKKTENFVSCFTKNKQKIIQIPTAVDTTCYSVNNERNISFTSENGVVMGFLGRLTYQKNPQVILDALANLDADLNLRLIIAGDGPLRHDLDKKVEKLKIKDKVIFLGIISGQEKMDLLINLDIYLMPSIVEGCPIALLDAMAAGKAIIASDISSIREVVIHNKEAILINPYSVDELTESILLLYNNHSLRIQLGLRARECSKFYDFNVIYNRIYLIYKKMLEKHGFH